MALAPATLSIKDSTGAAKTVPVISDAAGNLTPVHSTEQAGCDTYSYSNAAFAPVATPQSMVVIQGSATRTVRVKRIAVGGAATAAGSMQVEVVRRSTAGTLGSAVLTAVTPAKHDTGSPAATAVVSTVGTANYTTEGASAGIVSSGRLTLVCIGSATTSGEGKPFVWEPAANSNSLVLRATSQYLTIGGLGSAIPAGGVLDIDIVLQEDAS